MTRRVDAICRAAVGLRDAHDDVDALIVALGQALDADDLIVLRPRGRQVIALSASREGGTWRSATDAVGSIGASALEDADPYALVLEAAHELSMPADGSWSAGRAHSGPLVLGVRDADMGLSDNCAGALATILDVLITRQLRFVTGRMNAVLEERARIASAIHEGVSQELATIAVQTEVLAQLVGDHLQATELVGLIRTTARQTMSNVRTAIVDLTPVVPDDVWLADGLRRFVDDFSSKSALRVSFTVAGAPRMIAPGALGLVFAFVQEGLTNLRKHSSAHSGIVEVAYSHDAVAVTVSNDGGSNGRGHSVESTGQGLDLMRGRARLLGGDVRVTNGSTGGREVTLRLPL